ncbi:MAG: HAMP domain-containing histidine kinase [Oscillospiraceae bacterium]|nr:HAMP domain-containing histidine kinase [Oscillospiraceae bacterium]
MKSKILKLGIIIVIVLTVLSITVNTFLHRNYTRRVNEVVLAIVGIVRVEYPDVSTEELLGVLNNNELSLHGLERYGIDSDDIDMIRNTREAYNLWMWSNILVLILMAISFALLLLAYIRNRKNKVEEITKYIREISRKNYTLKLEENVEDELSTLQNELYKITVLLKEQSENAVTDKKNVKDSLSDISHQLKTPLTSIMVGLDNLIDNIEMDAETREEFLYDMKNQTETINFLISSILKLSRLDSNVIQFDKQEIIIRTLLNEVLKNLESMSEAKKINIEIHGEEDIKFLGDYKWELEALTNIIKNCIEYSNENGIIKINYRKLSIYTEVVIEDNGKGMDAKDLKNIFERFYKGKNSSNESIGIGMSLSKKIIENDNGDISVKSTIGKGTTFTIRYMK